VIRAEVETDINGDLRLRLEKLFHGNYSLSYLEKEFLHSGDYVLLFWYRGISYDRAQQRLLWTDGRTKAADEVLALDDGILLLRAK
jgi:hypothetical protein